MNVTQHILKINLELWKCSHIKINCSNLILCCPLLCGVLKRPLIHIMNKNVRKEQMAVKVACQLKRIRQMSLPILYHQIFTNFIACTHIICQISIYKMLCMYMCIFVLLSGLYVHIFSMWDFFKQSLFTAYIF